RGEGLVHLEVEAGALKIRPQDVGGPYLLAGGDGAVVHALIADELLQELDGLIGQALVHGHRDSSPADTIPSRLQSPGMRVIDMECSVPKREDAGAPAGPPPDPAKPGMGNYSRIFRSRKDGGSDRPTTPLDDYVTQLVKAGIVRSVPFGTTNDEAAALARDYPDHFIGLARISAFTGMRGVRELEQRVREEGFKALGVSALVDGIPASDRRFYPLYTKAAEL